MDAYELRVSKEARSDSAQRWLERWKASRRYVERLDPMANSAAVATEPSLSDEMLDEAMSHLKKAVDVGRGRSMAAARDIVVAVVHLETRGQHVVALQVNRDPRRVAYLGVPLQ